LAQGEGGDPIGDVGNSGESTEPNLHFHVMNSADVNMGEVFRQSLRMESAVVQRLPADRQRGFTQRNSFSLRSSRKPYSPTLDGPEEFGVLVPSKQESNPRPNPLAAAATSRTGRNTVL
jgi:murein DD-endopeptidase MepM/ murein hydrolase activator NlpD